MKLNTATPAYPQTLIFQQLNESVHGTHFLSQLYRQLLCSRPFWEIYDTSLFTSVLGNLNESLSALLTCSVCN